ncbi:hypothetical protein FE772_12660 [Lysobacter enzymogenes]|nr:hypothetical protein [Lysobacter enzymogenes]QCW26389.1 hypothetical protein FE772_12660 [Lysobacter enzymogenes]
MRAALAIEARRLDASSPSFPAPADWDAAERHDAFWMYKPRDGVASPLRTQVQVACDDQALFFRVVADGQGSGGVRAPLARRDQIADDQDYVSVFIDTNGDGKSAYFFRVNPSGSLADGTYVAISDNQDFHPDFDASARGAANADGYAVDLRIARSQLRNRGSDGRGWRYLVMRNVPGAERMILASGELKQNATSYLSASQPLDMARCPGAGGEWEAGAHLTARRHEQKTGAVSQSDGVDTQLGGYLKWSDGAHLAVHATYRPDFSQVELDIPQLQSNAQYALFLPEKRDFFLEDTDLLELPTRSQLQGGGGGLAVYTRTITDPRWGARMSYRNQGRDFTALVADDRAGGVVAIPARSAPPTSRSRPRCCCWSAPASRAAPGVSASSSAIATTTAPAATPSPAPTRRGSPAPSPRRGRCCCSRPPPRSRNRACCARASAARARMHSWTGRDWDATGKPR